MDEVDEIRLTADEYRALVSLLAQAKDKKDLEGIANRFTPHGLELIASGLNKITEALRLCWTRDGGE